MFLQKDLPLKYTQVRQVSIDQEHMDKPQKGESLCSSPQTTSLQRTVQLHNSNG